MIEFTKYAQIKDRYCVCYFGPAEEYVLQLMLLKPVIEEKYQGVQIFVGCRDESANLFPNNNFVFKHSDLRTRRFDFGHIKELRFNGKTHPIEQFLEESNILNYAINTNLQIEKTSRCVILTKGCFPTISLNDDQVEKLVRIAKSEGYDVEIDQPVQNSGLVMGVESFGLFQAASQGIETKLIPTGFGTELYKKMFPFAKLHEV